MDSYPSEIKIIKAQPFLNIFHLCPEPYRIIKEFLLSNKIVNKVLILSLVLISLSCEKESDIILKYYDSEIFSGNDKQIYGNWKYLYTLSGGGFAGTYSKVDNHLPSLKIKAIGYYEKFREDTILTKGKIEILGQFNNHLLVRFCPNGESNPEIASQIIYTRNVDTLITGWAFYTDFFYNEYYKREK